MMYTRIGGNVNRFVSGIITSIENIVINKSDNNFAIGTNSIETIICLDGRETYKLKDGMNLSIDQRVGLYFNKDNSEVEAIIDDKEKFNFLLEREKTNKYALRIARCMLILGALLHLPIFYRMIFSENLYGLPPFICIFSYFLFLFSISITDSIKNDTLSSKDKENIENYLNTANEDNNTEKKENNLQYQKIN